MKNMYMENIELRIKVEQLEMENKQLKKELEKFLNIYHPTKEMEMMEVFREVEERLENEELLSEERSIYRGLGSVRKRDKEILMALSLNNGLSRDDIIKLFFANIQNPINSCNTVMKRLYRDGHVKVDRNTNPYTYFSKHQFKKPSYEGYIYLIKEFHSNTFKIGKTKNIEERLRMFNVKLPFDWELIHKIKTSDYTLAEKLIHKEFQSNRIKGSEWFIFTDKEVENIKHHQFKNDEINSLIIDSFQE